MWAPSGTSAGASVEPSSAGRLRARPDRPDADVLVAEVGEPVVEGASREDRRELRAELLLILVVLPIREVGAIEELAEPPEELRLERADGEVAPVCRRVDAVAGEPSREEPRHGLAAETVRDEVVRPMRHGDHEPARRARFARARAVAARTCVTAPSAPAARSAIWSGGSSGAVSSRTPAQPR